MTTNRPQAARPGNSPQRTYPGLQRLTVSDFEHGKRIVASVIGAEVANPDTTFQVKEFAKRIMGRLVSIHDRRR